jgi:hypothetical protein
MLHFSIGIYRYYIIQKIFMKQINYYRFYRDWLSGMFFFIFATSCSKLVTVDAPDNSITQENVYSDDLTASAVLTGIYFQLAYATGDSYGLPSISKFAGLSADEFALWTGADVVSAAYFTNSLAAPATGSSISAGHEFWVSCYPLIYTCNSAIEGISASKSLSPSVKRQLLGEAKFMRSFLYFYLFNLYGDLPLATSTDLEINRLLPRSDKNSVYKLLIDDLKETQDLLSINYLTATLVPYTGIPERVRPTKWAATALLARVYLYNKEYANAESTASLVLNNTSQYGLVPLANVFLKNNLEAIWQLQPGSAGWNTEDARTYNLAAVPAGLSSSKPVYLSSYLLSAFETGDARKVNWVASYSSGNTVYYYPNKYKQATQNASITSAAQMTEYRTVLRLAEQYLIRSEARALQNKIEESVADLNVLRARARMAPTANIPNPLPDIPTSISQSQLLNLILQERQVELFTEWGHRWFDLKRTGNIDIVMNTVTPQKGGSWQTTDQLYPIPFTEIKLNPSLAGHQNPGY